MTHFDFKTEKKPKNVEKSKSKQKSKGVKEPEPVKKPALQLAEAFIKQLQSIGYNFDNLMAVGCDSTRMNTGVDGGMVRHLENILGRKLNLLICCLHLVELPLRHLNAHFIGASKCGNKLAGNIGKCLDADMCSFALNPDFQVLDNFGSELPEMSPEVVKDLSTDQEILYRLIKMVTTGVIDDGVLQRECGPFCMARWLTCTCRLLRIYVRKDLKKTVKFMTYVKKGGGGVRIFYDTISLPNFFP